MTLSLRTSLVSCIVLAAAASPALAQKQRYEFAPVEAYNSSALNLPPSLRYGPGAIIITEPGAFYNGSDESGYASGLAENPNSN